MRYENVIFDLDGVLVSTDEYHYQAWKKIADEEGIYFDRAINNRLRGVSRMASLEIILERAAKNYTQAEKEELAQRKNRYYQELLGNLTTEDTLNGVRETLLDLRKNSVHIAVGSSSKMTSAPMAITPAYLKAGRFGKCIRCHCRRHGNHA